MRNGAPVTTPDPFDDWPCGGCYAGPGETCTCDLVAVECNCGAVLSVPLADASEPATCPACAARATRVGEPVHVGEVVVDVMEQLRGESR